MSHTPQFLKKRVRALQEQTGWSYSECLRLVRSKTEDEIDLVIEERAKQQIERRGLSDA